MKKISSAILLIPLAAIATSCIGSTTAPSSLPTLAAYTPVPLSMINQDTAYLAVVEGVISVIHGVVEKQKSTTTIQPKGEQFGVQYSDWSIRVIKYLVDPLPYEHITLRRVDYFIDTEGGRMGHRNPFTLAPGEEVILFLTKKGEVGQPLSAEEFTVYVAAGPGALTKVTIEGGKVEIIHQDKMVIEPAEDFIARIQRYAREAGRTTR